MVATMLRPRVLSRESAVVCLPVTDKSEKEVVAWN